jgi:hypothetical protein
MRNTFCFVNLWIAWLVLGDTPVNGDLTIKPENKKAWKGSGVRLECCTNLDDPLVWYFTPVGAHTSTEIFNGDHVIASNSNYQVDVTRSRCYTLVIPSVTKDHAGRYECQNNDGFGEKSPAEVTVIEMNSSLCHNTNNCVVSASVYGNNEPKSNECRTITSSVDPQVTFSCQICFAVSVVIEESSSEFICVNRNFTFNASRLFKTYLSPAQNSRTTSYVEATSGTTLQRIIVQGDTNGSLIIGLSIGLSLAVIIITLLAITVVKKTDIFKSIRKKEKLLEDNSQDKELVPLKVPLDTIQV